MPADSFLGLLMDSYSDGIGMKEKNLSGLSGKVC